MQSRKYHQLKHHACERFYFPWVVAVAVGDGGSGFGSNEDARDLRRKYVCPDREDFKILSVLLVRIHCLRDDFRKRSFFEDSGRPTAKERVFSEMDVQKIFQRWIHFQPCLHRPCHRRTFLSRY